MKLPDHNLDYQDKVNYDLQLMADAKKKADQQNVQRTELGQNTIREGRQY